MSAVADRLTDVDALERDAQARLAELDGLRQQLALDSLTSTRAARELAKVEDASAKCRGELERLALAKAERERRDFQAQEAAAAERRDAELQRARELQAEREKAARAVDAALLRFGRALADWDRITTRQEHALRGAGWNGEQALQARPRPWMIECAIASALREAGCPHGIVGLSNFQGPHSLGPGRVRPLAEHDARPVEPKSKR